LAQPPSMNTPRSSMDFSFFLPEPANGLSLRLTRLSVSVAFWLCARPGRETSHPRQVGSWHNAVRTSVGRTGLGSEDKGQGSTDPRNLAFLVRALDVLVLHVVHLSKHRSHPHGERRGILLDIHDLDLRLAGRRHGNGEGGGVGHGARRRDTAGCGMVPHRKPGRATEESICARQYGKRRERGHCPSHPRRPHCFDQQGVAKVALSVRCLKRTGGESGWINHFHAGHDLQPQTFSFQVRKKVVWSRMVSKMWKWTTGKPVPDSAS
jgi:hypothetical protein